MTTFSYARTVPSSLRDCRLDPIDKRGEKQKKLESFSILDLVLEDFSLAVNRFYSASLLLSAAIVWCTRSAVCACAASV